MDNLLNIVRQEMNEKRFNRKHIDIRIREEILANPMMVEKIDQGIQLVEEYIAGSYYEQKNARIAQIKSMDVYSIVLDTFVGVAYCMTPELFTSVSALLASRMKLSEKLDAIKTVAELLAVLCNTDVFDITKKNKYASLMVISRMKFSKELLQFIADTQFLPPMVCEPKELLNNYESGYLTYNESVILGSGNHHNNDVCLDVLNKMNKVALKLDTDFISKVEELPTFDLDDREKVRQWNKFKTDSYNMYSLMVGQGNEFYLTHKVDCRGRIYASGYHITTQGTSHKKAMIELANEEIVEGAF